MRATLMILFMVTTRTLSKTQPCTRQLSVELKDRKYNGVTYSEGEYYEDENGVERGCVCMKGLCSRKCCPFGQAYNTKKRVCVEYTEPFNPPVWSYNKEVKGFNASKEFQFIFGKQECSPELKELRLFAYPAITIFRLTTDGTLYLEMADHVRNLPFSIFQPDKFCIDTFIKDWEPGQNTAELNALVCSVQEDKNHHVLSSTCMLISCFFIILTVGVYAWLPELRNLHGMILIAYLLCFFCGFISMSTMQILILKNENSGDTCIVLTFFIYFFMLGGFFWLNVMCYDIWYTFSGKRGQTSMTSVRSRFLKYSMYAFGMPTLLTVILAALEFSDLPANVPLMPRLRTGGCFLYKWSKLLYLYGPMTVLCIINLIFFILTAFKIAKIKKQTKQVLKSNESSTHDQHKKDKQRLSLYVKLFAVMGVSWILEMVSSLFPQADDVWMITDAYNVLIGLIIFIIFVCKKKTLNMLKNRSKDFLDKDDKMSQITNKNITRWQNNQAIRGSIETIRTTIEELDAKSVKSQKSSIFKLYSRN